MYYEINISENGKHLFATAERSITDEKQLKIVYDKLATAFPVPQYLITVLRYEKTGVAVKGYPNIFEK
jgi:hypothetical protein